MVRLPIIITGPTGAGKSELAVRLALQIDAEVISADSAQIYKGCDIGSAKLSLEERCGIKHHLIDILNPDQHFTVADFLNSCREIIANTAKPIIICGGTTFYLEMLLGGMAKLPASSPDVRAGLEECSTEKLHAKLQEVDPDRASQLNHNDRYRIIRALEIWQIAGKKPSELYAANNIGSPAAVVVLSRERDEMHARINARASKMVAAGLLDEVRTICEVYGKNAPIFSFIGYKEALMHLNGELAFSDLAPTIAAATRQYAKRQLTWCRNYFADFQHTFVEPPFYKTSKPIAPHAVKRKIELYEPTPRYITLQELAGIIGKAGVTYLTGY